MTVQTFTAYLDRPPQGDDYDRLFEAGLSDATAGIENGRGVLDVSREAESLTEAIVSVDDDVERAGFRLVGVSDDDVVSLKTVASRVGRTYESVRLLATGRRGPGGFPAPLSEDGWVLLSWSAVADWFRQHYGDEIVTDDRERILSAADLLLRARALNIPDSLVDLKELLTA